MPEIPARRPLRFGVFELDPQSGELRKAGVLVSLQEQSFKVLVELLDRPGDLVTRDQLRQRLWPNGTFVDFEHGLNAVINRLRETLGDSADSPRFIQTVPRRGYRFIAPVEGAADAAHARAGATKRCRRPPDESDSWVAATDRQSDGDRRGQPDRSGRGDRAVSQTRRNRQPTPPSRAAHETGRQRKLAGVRARWRPGRVCLVGREVRQHGYLRHPGRLDRCSSPDDRRGRRLRTGVVAGWSANCVSTEVRKLRADSRHISAGWARREAE